MPATLRAAIKSHPLDVEIVSRELTRLLAVGGAELDWDSVHGIRVQRSRIRRARDDHTVTIAHG